MRSTGVTRVHRGHDTEGARRVSGYPTAAVCVPERRRIMPTGARTCKMLLSEGGMLTYEDSKKMCRVCKPCSRPVSQGVMQTQALPDARACAHLDVRERYEPPG